MSSTRIPDSVGLNKAGTLPPQLSNATANFTPSSVPFDRPTENDVGPPIGTHGSNRHRPHRDGEPDRAAHSTNGHHRVCDDPPGADHDPAVNRVEKWKICDLKEHPQQTEFFPDESAESDLDLAADMQANGQSKSIDILPDGTILGGHRRIKAAKRLEWTTIDVVVHPELADDADAAEAFFINDNSMRRQLTKLQKARCAKRRVELAKKGKAALPEECNDLRKTRDKIGKLLEISGREADRYLKVLKTPIEVQHALDAGHLSLQDAGSVAGLSEANQTRIADRIRQQGSEKAKDIVKEYQPSKAPIKRGARASWCSLRNALANALKELLGNTSEIGQMDEKDMDLIKEAKQLLAELTKHAANYLEKEGEVDSPDTHKLDPRIKI